MVVRSGNVLGFIPFPLHTISYSFSSLVDYLLSLFSDVEEDSKREAGQEMAVAGGAFSLPIFHFFPSFYGRGEREREAADVFLYTGICYPFIHGPSLMLAGEGSIPEAIADYSSDVSSPRAALDITDSDSSSSSNNNNNKGVAAVDPRTHRWRGIIKGLLQRKKSIKRFSTFPPPSTPEKTRWKLLPSLERNRTTGDNRACEMSLPLPLPPPSVRWRPTWRSFELKELAAATDDFSSGKKPPTVALSQRFFEYHDRIRNVADNVIGRGGHAEVYRGRLPCGQLVAVKRLKKKEKEMEEERVADFLSELGIIAHVNHANAAHLVGFGVEGGFHLVLEYSPHGSLASVLHGTIITTIMMMMMN